MALDSLDPLTAPMPAPPVRQFSFTDFQTNNPTAPPPGDRLDAEFDRANNAVTDTIAWANVTLNTDGTLRDGIIGESNLQPDLFDAVASDAIAQVQPLVDQAASYASAAGTSANGASTNATTASAQAVIAQGAASAANTAKVNASASATSAQGYANEALSTSVDAQNANNDAQGAANLAEDYAIVTQAWAEHMPDPIPPNILAVMGVTGDHWSSRWWANQAAAAFGALTSFYLGAFASAPAFTPTGGVIPTGAIYFNTTTDQMYVWDGDSWEQFYALAKSVTTSLAYSANGSQTAFPLTAVDLAGNTYHMSPTTPEPLEVYANGVKLLLNQPAGVGDWSVNVATSTVNLTAVPRAGTIIGVTVLTPSGVVPGGPFLPLNGGTLTGPLTNGAIAETASDLVPSRHLSNLVGKTSAVVAIIGDSTATAGPDQVGTAGGQLAANGVDPSQMVWAALCDKLRADNPQIINWTFTNFAIGGTAENAPTQPGSALGVPLPSWFTNPSQTWLSYVQAAAPDVLFYLFGTNASAAGTGAGAGPATFISDNLVAIEAWPTAPNIIMVTNKGSTPDDTTPGPDDLNSSNHLGQASFHRTFAKSNASGYTLFPKCVAKGFGLIDLGRYAASRLYGYDPAVQYMRAVSSALVTGKPLTTGLTNGVDASTVAKTTHGDFRLTFVLRGQGGAALSNYGFSAIRVGMSNFAGNYVRITVEPGGVGTLRARYALDGATASVPLQSGSLVTTTTGQDVVITVSASGSRIRTWINGTLAQDIAAPRFVTPTYGGCPINVNITNTPTGSPTIDVTEFYEGIGTPTMMTTDIDSAFGIYDQGNALTDGYQGGNSVNHQTSLSAAYDRRVISAMNFSALGVVSLPNLPTSSAGLAPGTLWNNSGFVCVI